MRAYLVGEPTIHLLRLARILREHGWQVDRTAAAGFGTGRYDIVVVERTESGLESRIGTVRRQVAHELLLVLGDFRDEERTILPGIDDVICRDAPGTLTMSRLMALLRLRLRSFQDCYRVGELVVDLARRRVRRNGRDILLSQREFQLLVLLAQEAGTILPRSVIMERLWSDDLGVADNAVDALASRLRRRIDGPFGVKMLRTVRGVGYCLTATEELRLAS